MESKDILERRKDLQKYGKNTLSYLTLSKTLEAFSGKWNGYIAYKNKFHTAVVLGDPIVPNSDLSKALKEFKDTLSNNHTHICFFVCSGRIVDAFKKENFKGFLIGHEAIVNLSTFDVSGRKAWSIRSSLNHARKCQLAVEEYNFNQHRSKEIEQELYRITKEWCRIKKMPELTFAFGHLDFFTYQDARIFICRKKEKIVGFLVYFPIYGVNSYYLDLSRRGLDAPRGTIDYLFVKSFEILRNEGIKKIYIGYSPTKNSQITAFSTVGGETLFKAFKPFLEFFYPAKSEYFFKNKYATEWEPNYFFYYPHISIRMLFGLVHAVYTGGIAGILFGKLRYLLKIS